MTLSIIEIDWESDPYGTVSVDLYTNQPLALERVVTLGRPYAPPTTNYDITLSDRNGVDLLDGLCANQDTLGPTTTPIYSTTSITDLQTFEVMQFRITNAGPSAAGITAIHFITA